MDILAQERFSRSDRKDRRLFDEVRRGYQLAFLGCLTAVLFCRLDVFSLRNAQPPVPLIECVNPNTDSLGSLMRLEGIGPVRALQIIQYRQQAQTPFQQTEDLDPVFGIGPKTISKVAPFIRFDNPQTSGKE